MSTRLGARIAPRSMAEKRSGMNAFLYDLSAWEIGG
jgi:hypothetical protein